MVLPPLECNGKFPYSVTFSPNGQQIICGADSYLYQWSTVSGSLIWGPLSGHADDVASVAFSPDGKCIASGDDGGEIRVWDTASGYKMFSPHQRHMGSINAIVFTSDGNHIVTGALDYTIGV